MVASGDPPDVRGIRCRVDDLHLAFCCEKGSSDRTRAMARSVGEAMMDCSGRVTLGMCGRRHLMYGRHPRDSQPGQRISVIRRSVENCRRKMTESAWRRFARRRVANLAWSKFQVFRPVRQGKPRGSIARTRRVLTGKMVGSRRDVKARWVAQGPQDPDSKAGLVKTPRRASLRSSHLQVVFLSAPEK